MGKLRFGEKGLVIGIHVQERASCLLRDVFEQINFKLTEAFLPCSHDKRLAVHIVKLIGLDSFIVKMKCGFGEQKEVMGSINAVC